MQETTPKRDKNRANSKKNRKNFIEYENNSYLCIRKIQDGKSFIYFSSF